MQGDADADPRAALDALDVGDGTRLLDVGCGAGLALTLAASRGATVAGLDAAQGLVDIAGTRLPDRHRDLGDPSRSEMRDVLGAIGALLPPPPPGAGGPFALSQPGALEELVESAGLTPRQAAEVPTPYEYLDVDTAVLAQTSSGPAVRAAQHAGEEAVHQALHEVMNRYRRADGSVRLGNVFRYLVATA